MKRKLIIFIIILVAFLSITSNGMWFDEICRVVDSINGNFSEMIKTSLGFAQPGYMLYMYIWINLFNNTSNEFLIRCSNLIFVIPCIYYAFKIIDKKQFPIYTVLLFFIHPMFIYYMNEATPYMLIYSLSLAYTYHIFFVDDFNSTKNIVTINIIYLIGVFSHFIFGFIIIPYLVYCLIQNWKNKEMLKKHILILMFFCLIYIPLLLTYLLHLKSTITGFGIKNIAFIIYGFLGMAGLGLPRNDLRALNFNKIKIYQIVLLIIFVTICLVLFSIFLSKKSKVIKENKNKIICLIAYFIGFLLVAFVIKFGIWERHCFAIFPLFIVILLDILKEISANKLGKIFIALLIIMWIISGINLSKNYIYFCDDHKGVYNKIKNINDNDVVILSNSDLKMYKLSDIVGEDKFNFSDNEEELKEKFKHSDNKTYLILYEKNTTKSTYNYYDNNNGYIVDDKYNSYKIIRHNN